MFFLPYPSSSSILAPSPLSPPLPLYPRPSPLPPLLPFYLCPFPSVLAPSPSVVIIDFPIHCLSILSVFLLFEYTSAGMTVSLLYWAFHEFQYRWLMFSYKNPSSNFTIDYWHIWYH